MRNPELDQPVPAPSPDSRAESPQETAGTTGVIPRLMLLLAVTVSGAAVMIYEFIAVRVLQRYFGGQIDVWASEIAVVMAGLALGYYFGGHVADRYRSPRILGLGIAIAGVLGAVILPAAEFAGERLLQTDTAIAWQPLMAASASSFLPFLTLGAVLPQVIRLYVPSFGAVGKAAGNIAALSTIGSILGVLATGMYLLTYFGVRETLYATSGVLIVTGLAVAWVPSRRLAVLAVAAALTLTAGAARAEILFQDYSAYHHIMVEDRGDTRTLWFDSDPESLMSISDPYAGGFEYTDFFHVPMMLDPTTRRVLFVGLGGGTGPKSFYKQYPNVQIDVVELDPMVLQVARKYFALPRDGRLSVTVADGRTFLQRNAGRYGAIILDAYSSGPRGGYLPYHLATKEFFELVNKRLINGGCVVYNVITYYGSGSVLPDIYRTMREVFPVVYAFQARTSQNTVLVAQKINYEALREDGTRDGRGYPNDPWLNHPMTYAQLQVIANELIKMDKPLLPVLPQRLLQSAAVPATGRVLTDDYAPTDTGARRQ